jgi:hypothetical protein
MAAALRFAARRLCGRALERPQPALLTAAAKDVPAGWIGHGRSSLRRPFSSSESSPPNLVNSNLADDVIPPDSPVWKMKVRVPISPW